MNTATDLNFKIFFSRSPRLPEITTFPTIILSPPYRNTWNDFGHSSRFRFTIYLSKSHDSVKGDLYLGFISDETSFEALEKSFEEVEVIEAKNFSEFFTIQNDMQTYRDLVHKFGGEAANHILLALNDLVALKKANKNPELISNAIRTRVFNLSFMRDSERYYAYHNASSILDGLEEEDFSAISTQLSLTYQNKSYSEKHSIHFSFEPESILPKRMAVLIGHNGLGKSRALYHIANSLLNNASNFSDKENGRPLINRVLALSTSSETLNSFPKEGKNKKIKYRRLAINRKGKVKDSRGFGSLCEQLIRSNDNLGNRTRWQLFINSIQSLPEIDKIVIPVNNGNSISSSHILNIEGKQYIPLIELKTSGEQYQLEILSNLNQNSNPKFNLDNCLTPLSSGQFAFLTFAIQACLFIENGTLVLLDEPETHLHPNLISDFIRILDALLKLTGSIAIIATHSVYFVREVPRQQVHVFKKNKDGRINIQNPKLKTFGSNIQNISYFVFEDEITNALVEDILDQFPEGLEEQNPLWTDLESELSAETVMYIRRKLSDRDTNEKN